MIRYTMDIGRNAQMEVQRESRYFVVCNVIRARQVQDQRTYRPIKEAGMRSASRMSAVVCRSASRAECAVVK